MTKQFYVTDREVLIRKYLVNSESIEEYHKGHFKVMKRIEDQCIECELLEIKEQ